MVTFIVSYKKPKAETLQVGGVNEMVYQHYGTHLKGCFVLAWT